MQRGHENLRAPGSALGGREILRMPSSAPGGREILELQAVFCMCLNRADNCLMEI